MRSPELHVGGIGRVADIERIEQQDATVIAIAHFITESLQAEFSHRIEVWNFETERIPLPKCECSGANFHPVIIIWRAIRLECCSTPTRGVDLTV